MIRTVTGDIADIDGPILARKYLQIDLCGQKGPDAVRAKRSGMALPTIFPTPCSAD